MNLEPGLPVTVPLDPELLVAFEKFRAEASEEDLAPMSAERLPGIRAEVAAEVAAVTDLTFGGRFTAAEAEAPGLDGAPGVPLLVLTPVGAPANRPVLYHLHGGGFFCNDHRTGLAQVLDTAERFGATLVSAGYRLAPEHRYPAQIDDAYAALLWTAEHAAELGADPERIVVTGLSAGGGLATALALTVRDKGGPGLLGLLLLCPMLDDRNDSASLRQMDSAGLWNRSFNGFGWSALLGEARGTEDVPQYAAPARARDLTGLPPLFLDAGSADGLRDEILAFAGRIWHAGGRAELHVWPGGTHAFDMDVPDARISRSAVAARHDWLERLLAGG